MDRDTISRDEYLRQEKEIIEKLNQKEIGYAETAFLLQKLRKQYPSWIWELFETERET